MLWVELVCLQEGRNFSHVSWKHRDCKRGRGRWRGLGCQIYPPSKAHPFTDASGERSFLAVFTVGSWHWAGFVDRFTCWRRTRFRSKSVCFPFIWRFWIGDEDSSVSQYHLQASDKHRFSLMWVSARGNVTQVSEYKKGLFLFEST